MIGVFKNTVSFGSVSSLVEMPAYMSHASIPEEERVIPQGKPCSTPPLGYTCFRVSHALGSAYRPHACVPKSLRCGHAILCAALAQPLLLIGMGMGMGIGTRACVLPWPSLCSPHLV